MQGEIKMDLLVECPECGRESKVLDGQYTFVCSDSNGCAFMCSLENLTGTLEYDHARESFTLKDVEELA